MANCARAELRIVAPRDPWPLSDIHRQRMMAASSGADDILENAKLFATVEEAIADLNYVYATTSRDNDMVNRILTPKAAIIRTWSARASRKPQCSAFFSGGTSGPYQRLCFAGERQNHIPLNPDFMSLNLAQCVLLIGYEWYQAKDQTPDNQIHVGKSQPATNDSYLNLFRRLEEELDEAGFFTDDDMRPVMRRNLQKRFAPRRNDGAGNPHMARRPFGPCRRPPP
jgi:tRNA/rRNA methyltransferase